MSKKRRKYQYCQNCNHQFLEIDNYCPECGQENHNKIASFKELASDFFGDYFNFDTKFLKTIGPLLFKPGFLTNEYNAGHRVKYLPPLRLYIFISIVFFFVLSLDSNPFFSQKGFMVLSTDDGRTDDNRMTIDFSDTTLVFNNTDSLRKVIDERGGIEAYLGSYEVKNEGMRNWLGKKMLIGVYENRSIMDVIVSNVSIMMFFLMPIFALLLHLLYWRRKKLYIEHLIFSFHYHAFFFISYTISLLFTKYIYSDFTINLLVFICTGVYLFFALKKVYAGKWFYRLIKLCILLFSYAILLLFGFVTTAILSVIFL